MKKIEYSQSEDIRNANTLARKLSFEYNSISPEDGDRKYQFLKKVLGNVGAGCVIHSPFLFDIGRNIHLGENVFINYNCVILDMTEVYIGNNVMIGPNVTISTASHSLSKMSRRRKEGHAMSIEIGDDVWIGCNVSILPGVKIGKGAVIGAGSVVTSDIPENVLAVGVPAKSIKQLPDE